MGDLRADFIRDADVCVDPAPESTPPEDVPSAWHRIARHIADTVAIKNSAYGNAFSQTAGFLQLLYPHGISPANYSRMLTLVRQWDKIKRFAANNDPSGENPQADIIGYALLFLAAEEKARSR